MANLTLTQARARVLRLVDDEAGRRYNSAGDFVEVDQALSFALSACLSRYKGGRLDLYFTGTSSATDGTLDVSSVVPLRIRGVAISVPPTLYQIPGKTLMVRGYPDLVARSLSVLYTREYVLSSTASDPLVGVGAVAAASWPMFDNWICLNAALELQPKDNEVRASLVEREAKAQDACEERPHGQGGAAWPRPEHIPFYADLQWQYDEQAQKLYLRRRAW